MEAKLRIHRYLDGRKWVQLYTVTVNVGMTILEALTEIKETQDPTLSFTCSCRSSICGACAVRVNDNAELACEILVENLLKRYDTDLLDIKPLGNFKAEFSMETGCKQSKEDFNRYKKYAGCILCGSCVSECNSLTYAEAVESVYDILLNGIIEKHPEAANS